jgi:hypothetical protein
MPAMRRLSILLLFLCLSMAPLEAKDAPAAAAVEITGRFEVRDGQRVLTLWGTPRERGFAQGYLTAERIVDGIGSDFERVLGPLIGLYKTLVRTAVVPRFAFDDAEIEELEGLYEGLKARLPDEKLVISALGRPVDLTDLKALNTFGDWYGLGCSSLAVWGNLTEGGKPLVGRNFDFPGFGLVLSHQIVVVRAPRGEHRGQVGVSYPGCIGTLTGMNSDGVFVAVHDVRVKSTLAALRPNVPRLLAVRRILEKTSGASACTQARDLARTWPTLYGNNLMVVTAGDGKTPCAGVLEYDNRTDIDEGCTLRCAEAGTDGKLPAACLTCTNHHRARPDPRGPDQLGSSSWRYGLLDAVGGVDQPAKPFDVDALFAWMDRVAFPRRGAPQQRAESIRGPGSHHGTLHQAVGEPVAKRIHIRLGVVGKNITTLPHRTYDVPALTQAARTPARSPQKAGAK